MRQQRRHKGGGRHPGLGGGGGEGVPESSINSSSIAGAILTRFLFQEMADWWWKEIKARKWPLVCQEAQIEMCPRNRGNSTRLAGLAKIAQAKVDAAQTYDKPAPRCAGK